MARAYSLDLRQRVVAAAASGQSCRSVAKTFVVSVASVVKWSQRQRALGSPAARKMGGHRPYLVARERDWVLARIAEKPDLTLRALLRELADRGLVVSYYALWHFLQHEGVTFKKKFRASEQDRPDVARRRERWKARQARINPRRLVFIDETWAKTNMTRAHGRCPRRTPRRQSALRAMANPHVLGGAALRRPHRALRHRRTDQWRELPRLCRATLVPVLAPGDIRHGRPSPRAAPFAPPPRVQSQAFFLPATGQTSTQSSRPSPK